MIWTIKDFLGTLWRQPDFTIRIEAGKARLWQGRAPRGFVDDCSELAVRHGVKRGLIYGLRRPQGLRLEFSRNIPERCEQHFRNAWQMYKGS